MWMSVEAIVCLGTAWTSHSPALLAFGGDRLIELLSPAVLFWRFRFALGEARAARIAGCLLFALAGFVVLTAVLNVFGYRETQRSLIGIGILLAAAAVMPWLASRKRKLPVVTSSAALKADAAESALCGYMAWIALVGLVVNAICIWNKPWADPVMRIATSRPDSQRLDDTPHRASVNAELPPACDRTCLRPVHCLEKSQEVRPTACSLQSGLQEEAPGTVFREFAATHVSGIL